MALAFLGLCAIVFGLIAGNRSLRLRNASTTLPPVTTNTTVNSNANIVSPSNTNTITNTTTAPNTNTLSNSGVTPPSNTNTIPQPTVIVESNQHLATAPHAFDVFRASDADTVIVFLHGGGGTKEAVEYALGLKTTPDTGSYDVANKDILLNNKIIAVFPQGQAYRRNATTTWSNYVMTSGQDDKQFLTDLVSYVKSQYHVSHIILSGHSNGGMMTSRVWCESPQLFDTYVAFAGPPSEHFLNAATPCAPTSPKPFLSMVGSADMVLRDSDWEAQTWTINPLLTAGSSFIDPVLIGERAFLPTKVSRRCGATVGAGESDATRQGVRTTWSYCNGSIKLVRLEGSGHSMDSIQSTSGSNMLQMAIDFAATVAQ